MFNLHISGTVNNHVKLMMWAAHDQVGRIFTKKLLPMLAGPSVVHILIELARFSEVKSFCCRARRPHGPND